MGSVETAESESTRSRAELRSCNLSNFTQPTAAAPRCLSRNCRPSCSSNGSVACGMRQAGRQILAIIGSSHMELVAQQIITDQTNWPARPSPGHVVAVSLCVDHSTESVSKSSGLKCKYATAGITFTFSLPTFGSVLMWQVSPARRPGRQIAENELQLEDALLLAYVIDTSLLMACRLQTE